MEQIGKIELIPQKLTINIEEYEAYTKTVPREDLFAKDAQGKCTGIDENSFAQAYIEENKCVCDNGILYAPYEKNGQLSDDQLKGSILGVLVDLGYKSGLNPTVNNLAAIIKLSCIGEVKPDPNILPFANGDLVITGTRPTTDLQTWTFQLNRKRCLPYRFAVDFPIKEAECPKWENYLSGLFCNDESDIETLQTALGEMMTPSSESQAALFLEGVSGCGKSQVLETFVGLLGAGTTQRFEIAHLHDTFGLENLSKALVIHDDEMPKRGLADASRLKAIISSGKHIAQRVNEKNKPHVSEQFYCSVLGVTNFGVDSLKARWDDNQALARRSIILSAKRGPLSDAEKIGDFGAHLLEEESAGIVLWLMRGLYNWFINNKNIPLSPSAEDNRALLANGVSKAFPALERFIHEQITPNNYTEGQMLQTVILYGDYSLFCMLNDLPDEFPAKDIDASVKSFGRRIKPYLSGLGWEQKEKVPYTDANGSETRRIGWVIKWKKHTIRLS